MRGKKKCELLKSIRCKIARQNGIDYTLSECTFQGECKGTCPKCEAELKQLSLELERLKQGGKRVAVAGIAAAMVATSAASCTPKEHENFWEAGGSSDEWGLLPAPEKDEFALEGKFEEPLDTLDGDIALPEEEKDDFYGEIEEPIEPDEPLTGDIILNPEEEA